MKRDLLLGVLIIIGSLGFMTYLIVWSRKIIERIAEKRLGSIREIVRELKNGG